MTNKKALRIFTAQEHEMMGSTPLNPKAFEKPFTPEALVDGSSDVAIIDEVRQGEVIEAMAASQYFGLELLEVPMIKLSKLDHETGEVIDKIPQLVGIHDLLRNEIVRDPEILEVHTLSEEGKRKLFVGEVVRASSQEQKG